MCFCLHVKYPLFWSDLNEIWTISTDFRKIVKYKISRIYVEWRPDRHGEANIRFSQFCERASKLVAIFRLIFLTLPAASMMDHNPKFRIHALSPSSASLDFIQ